MIETVGIVIVVVEMIGDDQRHIEAVGSNMGRGNQEPKLNWQEQQRTLNDVEINIS